MPFKMCSKLESILMGPVGTNSRTVGWQGFALEQWYVAKCIIDPEVWIPLGKHDYPLAPVEQNLAIVLGVFLSDDNPCLDVPNNQSSPPLHWVKSG